MKTQTPQTRPGWPINRPPMLAIVMASLLSAMTIPPAIADNDDNRQSNQNNRVYGRDNDNRQGNWDNRDNDNHQHDWNNGRDDDDRQGNWNNGRRYKKGKWHKYRGKWNTQQQQYYQPNLPPNRYIYTPPPVYYVPPQSPGTNLLFPYYVR